MTASPRTLRTRNMTAAKRSLTLIRDAVLLHLDILEDGTVPESSFTASVTKYEAALTALRTLDALGEDGTDDPGIVEVQREGLAALIDLLRASEVGYAIQDAEDGSLLADVLTAIYPDGIVPEPQDDPEPVTRGGYPVGP